MFGPPQRFTIASACSWLGHQVSGLRHDTSHPVQIRFRFGSATLSLNLASHRNSPARSTKSTTSRAYGALSACRLTVSGSLSLPSRGSFHLSLTVLSSIGRHSVLSLGGWSPLLPAGFLVPCGTPDLACPLLLFAYAAFTLSRSSFQMLRLRFRFSLAVLYPGGPQPAGLGSALFARRYWGRLV